MSPELAPIPVTVGTMGVFPNLSKPRVLWVGITTGLKELTAMQEKMEAALEACGICARGTGLPAAPYAGAHEGRQEDPKGWTRPLRATRNFQRAPSRRRR